MKRPSKLKKPSWRLFNTVGLAGFAAISAATLNPVPLLGALVVEAAYLLFVPDSKWFERRLASKYDKEVEDRRRKLRDQVFPRSARTCRLVSFGWKPSAIRSARKPSTDA